MEHVLFIDVMPVIATDMSCRSRLAELNEKITALERKVEYVEASVSFYVDMVLLEDNFRD